MKMACVKCEDDKEWELFSQVMNENGYRWRSGESLLRHYVKADFYYVSQEGGGRKCITYSRGLCPTVDDDGAEMNAMTLQKFFQNFKEFLKGIEPEPEKFEPNKELLSFLGSFNVF